MAAEGIRPVTDNEKGDLVWAAIDACRRWEKLKEFSEQLPAELRAYVDVSRAYAETRAATPRATARCRCLNTWLPSRS